jgi:hypothetical protein
MNYELKYLKYKTKYLALKKQIGGDNKLRVYEKGNISKPFYEVVLEDDDDINTVKIAIKDKFKAEKNKEINIDDIVLYKLVELPSTKSKACSIANKINHIKNNESSNLCMEIKKSVDIADQIVFRVNDTYDDIATKELLRTKKIELSTDVHKLSESQKQFLVDKIKKAIIKLNNSGNKYLSFFNDIWKEQFGDDEPPPPPAPPIQSSKGVRQEYDHIIRMFSDTPFKLYEVNFIFRSGSLMYWMKDDKNNLYEVEVDRNNGKLLYIINKGVINEDGLD